MCEGDKYVCIRCGAVQRGNLVPVQAIGSQLHQDSLRKGVTRSDALQQSTNPEAISSRDQQSISNQVNGASSQANDFSDRQLSKSSGLYSNLMQPSSSLHASMKQSTSREQDIVGLINQTPQHGQSHSNVYQQIQTCDYDNRHKSTELSKLGSSHIQNMPVTIIGNYGNQGVNSREQLRPTSGTTNSNSVSNKIVIKCQMIKLTVANKTTTYDPVLINNSIRM